MICSSFIYDNYADFCNVLEKLGRSHSWNKMKKKAVEVARDE